jgi:hypothetical protein
MRLEISIDSLSHQIDSTDPELLGKWIMEIFARAAAWGLNDGTLIQGRAQPSWVLSSQTPSGVTPDWISDSRITGQVFTVTSPRDLLAVLSRQLEEGGAL